MMQFSKFLCFVLKHKKVHSEEDIFDTGNAKYIFFKEATIVLLVIFKAFTDTK